MDIRPRSSEVALSSPAEATDHENLLSLRDLLRVLWQRLWIIVLVATLLTGLATGVSLMLTPQYTASVKILDVCCVD